MWTAKLKPGFAAAVCAAYSDERHSRKIVDQINPEKTSVVVGCSRGLSFFRPMARAGQAQHLLAESFVPGAVRGDGLCIR